MDRSSPLYPVGPGHVHLPPLLFEGKSVLFLSRELQNTWMVIGLLQPGQGEQPTTVSS